VLIPRNGAIVLNCFKARQLMCRIGRCENFFRCDKRATADQIRLRNARLAQPIMAVNPDLVAVAPGPMSRHPNIISPVIPIARTMDVVRLIADCDADRNGISESADAENYCQN
jgi:hypothetical protein